jgi:hypothetical protein
MPFDADNPEYNDEDFDLDDMRDSYDHDDDIADEEDFDDDFDDSMDGDHESAMDSIGWGDDDSLAYGGGDYGNDW